jgi:hypothetical protein
MRARSRHEWPGWQLKARQQAAVACVWLRHRMPPRAWRSTAPVSWTPPSVGRSTSRPLVRWLHASAGSAPPTNGLPSRDDRIIGFAYGQPLKRLAALQWSAEAGVYVDVQHHRAGGGRELYTQLLRRLTERGYNPTRPATPFIDPSGSGTLAHTVAWHGCNSICLRPAVRMDRPARFANPRSAGDGALRNRQGAMASAIGLAKVDPWTRHPPAVHIDTCEHPDKNLRPRRRLRCAPSGIRTHTGRILSPLPLPIGLWGPATNVARGC